MGDVKKTVTLRPYALWFRFLFGLKNWCLRPKILQLCHEICSKIAVRTVNNFKDNLGTTWIDIKSSKLKNVFCMSFHSGNWPHRSKAREPPSYFLLATLSAAWPVKNSTRNKVKFWRRRMIFQSVVQTDTFGATNSFPFWLTSVDIFQWL